MKPVKNISHEFHPNNLYSRALRSNTSVDMYCFVVSKCDFVNAVLTNNSDPSKTDTLPSGQALLLPRLIEPTVTYIHYRSYPALYN